LAGHEVSWVFQVVEQELVESAAFIVENLDGITIAIVDGARVDNSAEGVDGFRVTGPFVVDLLTDGGELDGLAGWSTVEDFVSADWHGNNLGLEGGGKIRDLDLGADSLVGFHVEALDSVGTIDLGDELRVEGNHNSGGDKHTSGVQRTGAGNIAAIERQFNTGNLSSAFFGSAFGVVEQSFHVDVTFKRISRVEVHSHGGGPAFNLGFTFDTVVYGNSMAQAQKYDH